MIPSKISRLPVPLRNELNHRLAQRESSATLLPWLNSLPVVQELLVREFHGRPISKQNLHKYRHHGFAIWQLRQEVFAQAQADATTPDTAPTSVWTEHLSQLTTLHYVVAVASWDGQSNAPFRGRFRAVRTLAREAHQLRAAELHRQRQQLAQSALCPELALADRPNPSSLAPDTRDEDLRFPVSGLRSRFNSPTKSPLVNPRQPHKFNTASCPLPASQLTPPPGPEKLSRSPVTPELSPFYATIGIAGETAKHNHRQQDNVGDPSYLPKIPGW